MARAQPQQPPANRQQLLELVASLIGWGCSADDVEPIAEQLEKAGVEFIPSALLSPDFKNPYKKDQGK